jgi:hypothetical protein
MSLKDQIAALRGKAAKGDTAALAELKSMGVALKAAADDAPADDTDKTDAADEEEDQQDGGADEDKEGEGDETDDKEPKPAGTGTKPGFALLRSKEAKGRTALANRLAQSVASGKLTYGEARDMLADAPKARPLADAMANRDHNPGADHGEPGKAGAGLGAAIDRMNAKKTGTR